MKNVISISDLAALVRDVRKRRGWTQAELAERAGVSREWIIGLEKAKPSVEAVLVFRTLRALNLSLTIGAEIQEEATEGFINLDELLKKQNQQDK